MLREGEREEGRERGRRQRGVGKEMVGDVGGRLVDGRRCWKRKVKSRV